MFSISRVSRYRLYKTIVRQRRLIMSAVHKLEEPVVQAICWADPYALLTVVNNAYLQRSGALVRLVSEVFFDQQMRTLFHSSDAMTFMLLVMVFQFKLDLIKHESSSRNNDMSL